MRRAILLVVTVLAVTVLLPALGFGAQTTVHGGPPSDVFMSTEPEICAEVDVDGFAFMPTEVSFGQDSHLLVSFTSEYSGIAPRTELLLAFAITDQQGTFPGLASTPFEWGMPGAPTQVQHSTTTVMWSFPDMPSGSYIVWAGARVDPFPPGPGGKGHQSAVMENCSLTVSVMPAA